MKLTIYENPAGYSEGTWGWDIENDCHDHWFDGGFASRELAEEAGEEKLAELMTGA